MKFRVEKSRRKTALFLRTTALAGVVALSAGMQTAFAEPLVYVPMGSLGKILVVDAATDKIVNTIKGVAAIHGLAETPDGRFLVAGSLAGRKAGSKAPPKPEKMSDEDHAAHHSAASGSMSGMMGNDKKAGKTISTVSIIQIKDLSIVRRIDVPGAVHHVAVSPDGKFAAVTLIKQGAISIIDLATYKVVATIKTGARPNSTLFSPVNGGIYVSNAGSNTVSEINPANWSVHRNIPVGKEPGHLALSGDSQNLYVANDKDGTVSEIDLKDGDAERTFTIGKKLHGIDMSNDAKTLFVSALAQNKLVAIDLKTTQQRSVKITAPYHLATIGKTEKLYVSSATKPNITVVDQTSLAALGTITIGGKGHQMALPPGS
jgi:YVTN family beta-propeller protein